MSALPLIHDDYVAFCEGVRGLCDIDLLQYKRGQMERRVRSFADRHGHAGLAHYLQTLSGDAGSFTYVPTERFYDHFITTAGLEPEMSASAPVIMHLEQQLSSYLSSISDHVPVAVSMPIF